jgi:ketol-acid reductoisomerase
VIILVKVYYDKDVKSHLLKDKTVAVIGYGIQGTAQSLNMRDSGIKVILGLNKQVDESWRLAEKEGFEIYSIPEATKRGDIIHILIPDMVQSTVYEKEIKPYLTEGKALGFSHGFNIHFKLIVPPPFVDVFMVAPKSPGKRVREMYQAGFGVPALVSVYQDYTGNAEKMAMEMAKAIGCTKAGVLKCTFKDETESDLIGEQIVLVGGLMELIKNGFEVLVEEGYPPELSFFECCNEAKLIMDLIYESGITGMLNRVSETARFGGLTVGPKVLDKHVKENMRKAAKDVKSGKFTKMWLEDFKNGRPLLSKLQRKMEQHQIERIGREIRKMSGIEK